MIFASVEVIQFSGVDLNEGLHGNIPELNVDIVVYVLIVLGIILKLALYLFCTWAQKVLDSDMLEALAEDHLNDVMSNSIAIITAALASEITSVWWLDATGAIFISAVIIFRWALIILEQVKKIVGYTAPPEFIQIVSYL
jgi:divalent metal cation (Fe/Co/Zn/Cd) transporter